jgi:hypothetical protein
MAMTASLAGRTAPETNGPYGWPTPPEEYGRSRPTSAGTRAEEVFEDPCPTGEIEPVVIGTAVRDSADAMAALNLALARRMREAGMVVVFVTLIAHHASGAGDSTHARLAASGAVGLGVALWVGGVVLAVAHRLGARTHVWVGSPARLRQRHGRFRPHRLIAWQRGMEERTETVHRTAIGHSARLDQLEAAMLEVMAGRAPAGPAGPAPRTGWARRIRTFVRFLLGSAMVALAAATVWVLVQPAL